MSTPPRTVVAWLLALIGLILFPLLTVGLVRWPGYEASPRPVPPTALDPNRAEAQQPLSGTSSPPAKTAPAPGGSTP